MPLIAQLFPAREREDAAESSSKEQHINREAGTPLTTSDDYDDFEEFDDECLDSDMEGSILNRPRPKKRVRTPSVSQRNDKRASRILEALTLELKTLEDAAKTKVSEQDPHELYLSSEEDASESTDEYGSLYSCDDEDEVSNSSSLSSRRSQEDTARVVSLKFVGKPQVIEINPIQRRRKSSKRRESDSGVLSKGPSPPPHYSNSNYRLSTSSTGSSILSSSSIKQLPTRKSSKMANFSSFVTKRTNSFHSTSFVPEVSPSFLASDPYPTPDEQPKTPNGMWKSGKPFIQRTLSAAKKRPSMPRLNLSYTAGVVPRHSSLGLSQSYIEEEKSKGHVRTPTLEELRLEEKEEMEKEELVAGTGQAQKHIDVMQTTKNTTLPALPSPSPTTPMTPRSRTASMLGSLGRKKSLRGR